MSVNTDGLCSTCATFVWMKGVAMKRLATWLIGGAAIVLTVAVDAALAFDEPDGFRGAKWGDSEAIVREKLTASLNTRLFPCWAHGDATKWLADRSCSVDTTVGAVPVTAYLDFRADKLVGFSLAFGPDGYDVMERAFLDRFGAPTSARDEPVKTKAGVEHMNRRLTWLGATVRVELVRYAGKVTQSSALYRLLTDDDVAMKLRREGVSKAAEDLR